MVVVVVFLLLVDKLVKLGKERRNFYDYRSRMLYLAILQKLGKVGMV